MSKLSKKKVIGITGSMGSGKSEISRYLRKKYPVLEWVDAENYFVINCKTACKS
mgnify:CR=1 FL=1